MEDEPYRKQRNSEKFESWIETWSGRISRRNKVASSEEEAVEAIFDLERILEEEIH
jgi:hypothetical protein